MSGIAGCRILQRIDNGSVNKLKEIILCTNFFVRETKWGARKLACVDDFPILCIFLLPTERL